MVDSSRGSTSYYYNTTYIYIIGDALLTSKHPQLRNIEIFNTSNPYRLITFNVQTNLRNCCYPFPLSQK